MSLVGRWVGFWTDSDGMRRIFGPGLTRAPEGAIWSVIGRVAEETPSVGIWVVVTDIKSQPLGLPVAMRSTPEAANLIRWNVIDGMVFWKDTDPPPGDMGFGLEA